MYHSPILLYLIRRGKWYFMTVVLDGYSRLTWSCSGMQSCRVVSSRVNYPELADCLASRNCWQNRWNTFYHLCGTAVDFLLPLSCGMQCNFSAPLATSPIMRLRQYGLWQKNFCQRRERGKSTTMENKTLTTRSPIFRKHELLFLEVGWFFYLVGKKIHAPFHKFFWPK